MTQAGFCVQRWGGTLDYVRLTGGFDVRYSGDMSKIVFEIPIPRLSQTEKLSAPERRQVLRVLDALIEREQLRRQAGEELRVMMDKLADANIPPMSMDEIQVEVNAVRKARRARRAHSA